MLVLDLCQMVSAFFKSMQEKVKVAFIRQTNFGSSILVVVSFIDEALVFKNTKITLRHQL
ncbi:uncharacterized protein PHALS_14811 [Plasmopara halstedii]|uniref:Uncharacterized protein n=1 Tax=Plasmopara halstedii TaxID=4781 RepID=A0A0P1AUP4_PLAHL|nr:uncharacterized protein PHALS_14811 [Plasmopara halstedii]CEG45426.1 hypothetical protein PHALS_14811 [Plasmopara halstedii]|eukprot:XP_024581795.1 hypothetical protein PHALS_14811 [Plasmopara halstedii]